MRNIRDVLNDLRIPYAGEGTGGGRPGWIQLSCPDCGDISSKGYRKQYLGISVTTGASSCWRCGRKSTAGVLAKLSGRPIREIIGRLEGIAYSPVPVRPTGRLSLPKGCGSLLPGHEAYLRSRGFEPFHIAAIWGVQGIGYAPRLKWRLFIPIRQYGVTVSWTTRSIKPRERMRYISASQEEESVPHKHLLYGADYATHGIVIHEGPLDVWATGPGAVATLGTGYTERQLKAMARYPIRAVCFDGEPEAQRRARELADALSVFPGTTHNIVLETGNDPAEADPAELAELRKKFL